MNSRWRGRYEELGLTDKKTVGAGHGPGQGKRCVFQAGTSPGPTDREIGIMSNTTERPTQNHRAQATGPAGCILYQAGQGEAPGDCLWDYHIALDSGGDLHRGSGSLSLYENKPDRQDAGPISPVSAGYRLRGARFVEPPDLWGSSFLSGRSGSDDH